MIKSVLSAISGITTLANKFIDIWRQKDAEKTGSVKTENKDLKADNEALTKMLATANNPDDAVDSLRRSDF